MRASKRSSMPERSILISMHISWTVLDSTKDLHEVQTGPPRQGLMTHLRCAHTCKYECSRELEIQLHQATSPISPSEKATEKERKEKNIGVSHFCYLSSSIDGQRQTLLAAKAQMGGVCFTNTFGGLVQAGARAVRRMGGQAHLCFRMPVIAGGQMGRGAGGQSVSQSCATMLRSRVSSTRCAQFNADEGPRGVDQLSSAQLCRCFHIAFY